jgi:hypothetical protein
MPISKEIRVRHGDYYAAVRCGGIVVDGPRKLADALPGWFMWSPMARFVRSASTSGRATLSAEQTRRHPAAWAVRAIEGRRRA